MRNAQYKQLVSIVVPVYNERGNIELLHNALIDTMSRANIAFELIYIDDNSQDGTYEKLVNITSASTEGNILVFRKQGKKGKAYSLLEGYAYAQGNVLAMIDADLQYPPSA